MYISIVESNCKSTALICHELEYTQKKPQMILHDLVDSEIRSTTSELLTFYFF
jgi:hypothetical protein